MDSRDRIAEAAQDIVKTRRMPAQKPGRSWQDVGTPKWLLTLVERTWGRITYDAAASAENHACPQYADGSPGYDGLLVNWDHESSVWASWLNEDGDNRIRTVPGLTWVNPPYAKIRPWVQKAATSGCLVVMLVPAAVGSNWWKDWVDKKAAVYFLSPRLKFVGHTQGYPKDLALLVYGAEKPSYKCVRVTEESATISIGDENELAN